MFHKVSGLNMFRNVSQRTKTVAFFGMTLGTGVTIYQAKPRWNSFVIKSHLERQGISELKEILRKDDIDGLKELEKRLRDVHNLQSFVRVLIDPAQYVRYNGGYGHEREYKIQNGYIINICEIAKSMGIVLSSTYEPKIAEYLFETGRITESDIGSMINDTSKLGKSIVNLIANHGLSKYVSQSAIVSQFIKYGQWTSNDYTLFLNWSIVTNSATKMQAFDEIVLQRMSRRDFNVNDCDVIIHASRIFCLDPKTVTIQPPKLLLNNQMLRNLDKLSKEGFKFAANEWINRIHYSDMTWKKLLEFNTNYSSLNSHQKKHRQMYSDSMELLDQELMRSVIKLMQNHGGSNKIDFAELSRDVDSTVRSKTAQSTQY